MTNNSQNFFTAHVNHDTITIKKGAKAIFLTNHGDANAGDGAVVWTGDNSNPQGNSDPISMAIDETKTFPYMGMYYPQITFDGTATIFDIEVFY